MGKAIRINASTEIEYREGSLASGWVVYNVRTALRANAGLYGTQEEARLAAEALHIACESLAGENEPCRECGEDASEDDRPMKDDALCWDCYRDIYGEEGE
jgi:formylmethanofuran dehydrogenase subunit E